MGFVADTIANLLNGVSQAPPSQRDSSQLEEQVNALSSLTRGLRKRPPTEHVAKLSSSPTGYESAFVHPVVRSDAEKYRAIIVNGDLKVFDSTGVEQTVIFPQGKAYLAGTEFRAITVGDTTYIVNRGMTVVKGLKESDPQTLEGFLVVRSVVSGTTYSVTIDGTTVYYTATSSDANTDSIAEYLRGNLAANSSFIAAGFSFTRFGSTIRVVRNDGADFSLAATDGLGNAALSVIKGQVQAFTDLPQYCRNGAIVEIIGAPETEVDNYYVQYSDAPVLGEAGVWREVPKPNVLVAFDPSTLPHTLVRKGYILPPTIAAGTPPLPAIGSGAGSTTNYGWQKDDTGTVTKGETLDWTVTGQGTGWRTSPTGFDGTSRKITVRYNFSAKSTYSPTGYSSAVLLTNTGPATAFVERARKDYYDGTGGFNNQELTYTANIPAGAEVMFRLEYSTAPAYGTVPSPPAALTGLSKTNVAGAGLTVQQDVGLAITFDATQKYAAGCTVAVTLNGTDTFSYVVGATDETGVQVATGLHALINASVAYDSTNPSAGLVVAKTAGGATPTATGTITFNPTTTFWNPDIALIPGAYVGASMRNLTDGSTGTITGNTATTVTVGAKVGGSDSVFDEGDVCVIESTGTYFVFGEAVWAERGAGDDTTCPFPSIVDQAISDVYYFQNRLGFTAGENIVLSASGNPLRFFRSSATKLQADDPIDVKANLGKVSQFQSAVAWTDGLYVSADHATYRLTGSPALTPETVRLDLMAEHPISAKVRPAIGANALVIPSERGGAVRIAEARVQTTQSGDDSLVFNDITKHVPTYLAGNIVALACDPQAEIICAVTSGGAQRSLYVCVYHDVGDKREQLSWSRWDFAPGSVLVGLDILDGVIGLVFKRPDGAYLETLALEPQEVSRQLIYDGTATYGGAYKYGGYLG